MPLTTTWTRSSLSKCGWAFSLRDPAVGGPARVADARGGRPRGDGDGAPLDLVLARGERLPQEAEVADRAHRLELAVGQHGDARRVVPAVLKFFRPSRRMSWTGLLPT